MALNYEFPQRLNLDKYDVYLEQPLNDTSYIFIDKLPRILTYGKHFGTLSWRSLKGKPQLKHGSKILFELKDSNGNIIKTDLSNTPPVNGAAVFYVWVEQNPKIFTGDRYQLADGPCKLTVVYELDNVPAKWKNRYNARSTFEFELQKNLPNTSPILFYSSSLVSSSFSISESIESDVGGTDAGPIDSYDRSVLHISTSNLTTEGGKVDFVEVSYNESRENTPDFKLLTTYPISSSGEFFEVSSSTAAGLNPLSHVQKVVTPKDIRRNGDVTFRIRFLNSNQEVARRLVDNSEITASTLLNVIGSPLLLETNDNLVHDSGGLFFGNRLTDGIKVKFDKGDAKEQSRLVFQKFKDGVFEKEVSRIEAERAEYVFGDTKDNKIKDSSGSAIIGGGRNKITSSVSSSVLSSTDASVFSSSFSNVALSKDSTIVFATQSSIVGGEFNQISGGLDNFIAGGLSHSMDKAGVGSIIGGINNSITELEDLNLLARGFNTIVGGRTNRIGTGSFAYGNTIVGGTNASLGTNGKGGVANLIAGGDQNHITGGANQVIIGGQLNRIQSSTIAQQGNVIIGSTGITIPDSTIRVAVIAMSNFTRSAAECDQDTLYVTNTDVEQKLNVRGLLVTTGSVIVGEDLTVEGTLTAQEFHTEFTSASIIYESGSTQFGDTLDDTHDFSGSLNVVGNITASGNISGSATSTLTIGGALNAGNASFANVQMADLESVTNITASGNISSSGDIITSGQISSSSTIKGNSLNGNGMFINGAGVLTFREDDGTGVGISSPVNSKLLFHQPDDTNTAFLEVEYTGINVTGEITASGNISSSGNVYASRVYINDASALQGGTNSLTLGLAHNTWTTIEIGKASGVSQQLNMNGPIDAASHITASGNISASGTIIGLNLSGTNTGDQDLSGLAVVDGGAISENVFVIGSDGGTAITDSGVTLKDSGATVNFGTLNISSSGFISTKSHITASGNISASGDVIARSGSFDVISRVGDPDTRIYFSDDDINIMVGGINMVDFTEAGSDEITFNEQAADLDVRIEGEDDPNLFFTDASTPGRVGIGTNTPTKKLQVEGEISASGTGSFAGLNIGGGLFTSASLAAGGGSFNNFTVTADGGSDQTIEDGNTLDIAGGTNITTAVGATDTVTVNLDASPSVTNITASGDISASGNIIVGDGGHLLINNGDNIYFHDPDESFSISGVRFATDHGKLDFVAGGNVGSALQLWNSGSAGNGFRAIRTGINTPGSYAAHTHTLTIGGDMSVSSSLFKGDITASGNLVATSSLFKGDITASGQISASGTGTHRFAGITQHDRIIVDDISLDGSTISDGDELTISSTNELLLNSTADRIRVTANITASGNISASGNVISNEITASGLNLVGSGTAELEVDGNITSSGNISASGHAHKFGDTNANTSIFTNGVHTLQRTTTGDLQIGNLDDEAQTKFSIYVGGSFGGEAITITGSNGYVGINDETPTDARLAVGGNMRVDSHITASGNISSSGNVVGVTGSLKHIVVNDGSGVGKIQDGGGELHLVSDDLQFIGDSVKFVSSGTEVISIDPTSNPIDFASTKNIGFSKAISSTHITASGGIKAGGDISSSDNIKVDKSYWINSNGTQYPAISQSSAELHIGDNLANDNAMNMILKTAANNCEFKFGDAYGDKFLFNQPIYGTQFSSSTGAYYGSASYFEFKNDTTGPSELRLHCEANSHYIGIRGPVHSGASSYVLKLPNTAPSDDQILKVNGSPSGGEVTLAWESDGGGGTSFPTTDVVSSSTDLFIGKTDGAFVSASQGNIRLSGSGQGQIEVDRRLFDTGSATLLTAGGGMGDIVKFGNTSGLTAGDLYHLTADGTWSVTRNDQANTCTGSLGIPLGASAEGNGVLLKGMVKLDNDPAASIGAPLYIDGAAGHITKTPPDTSGDIVRIVGHYYSGSGVIYFNPDSTFIEVA